MQLPVFQRYDLVLCRDAFVSQHQCALLLFPRETVVIKPTAMRRYLACP
jgi:hypothetical protein